MFVNYRGSIFGVILWQWKSLAIFLAGSTGVVLLHELESVPLQRFALPTLPVAVVGGALGIFASFRTNSCYDRWWEGRKLWGLLINTSRMWSTQVLIYLKAAPREMQERMIRRHIAYVHLLRVLLRNQDPAADTDLTLFASDEEMSGILRESNPTHYLLQLQAEDMIQAHEAGHLDSWRLQTLDGSVAKLLDIQGGCERIKKTPFPRGYGYFAERLIWAYSVILPLALVDQLGWFAIPMTLLVCTAFTLINEVGRVLEDPFTMFWPALPLSALSKTIEVNLRQRLGEADLPPLPKPDAKGILM